MGQVLADGADEPPFPDPLLNPIEMPKIGVFLVGKLLVEKDNKCRWISMTA